MKCIYNGRIHRVYSKVKVPEKKGQYLYFIRVGAPEKRLFKIGTTDDIMRRMVEHCGKYREEITILWVSPNYSKYTTLRMEDKHIDLWKTFEGFQYIKNDRFIIPACITSVTIKVRKEYKIKLD